MGASLAAFGLCHAGSQALLTGPATNRCYGLTSILGPLIGITIYFWTKPSFLGAIWLIAAAGYLFSIPVLARFGQRRAVPA